MNPLGLVSEWDFSRARFDLEDDLVALGADLAPGTVVAAYVNGVFPMGLGEGGGEPMGWWSPQRRGVLERGAFHASRSLRRSSRHFDVTFDVAFDAVIAACADPRRDGAWITDEIITAYTRLHELGVAHSVEVWRGDELAGGLYGLAIGGLFAGESMFHHVTDASKVALGALAQAVYDEDDVPRLIDVQWCTRHLGSLGVTEISREAYRTRLGRLVTAPEIASFQGRVAVLGNR